MKNKKKPGEFALSAIDNGMKISGYGCLIFLILIFIILLIIFL